MVKNELISEILKLDASDREYVLDVVTASLSDDLPPQLSPDDQKEILRRIEEFDRNPEAFIPWSEIKARLAAQRQGMKG